MYISGGRFCFNIRDGYGRTGTKLTRRYQAGQLPGWNSTFIGVVFVFEAGL